jgi:hypothetical protein
MINLFRVIINETMIVFPEPAEATSIVLDLEYEINRVVIAATIYFPS